MQVASTFLHAIFLSIQVRQKNAAAFNRRGGHEAPYAFSIVCVY
jgi:hypothetical protein